MQNGTFRSYFGAIAVPIIDRGNGTISNVTHDWANAMANLGAGLAVTIMRLNVRNIEVGKAKEKLAEMAIANNCDFILFVDDDVIPPGDALAKMLQLWKSDPKYSLISGIYWSKSEPSFPLIFNDDLRGSFYDWKVTDLIQADYGGAGLLFIDTNVFKKLPKPWFSTNYSFGDYRGDLDVERWILEDRLEKESNQKVKKEIKLNLKKLQEKIEQAKKTPDKEIYLNRKKDSAATEDIYFFKKCREYLGIRPWFDCSIQAPHQDKSTGRIFSIPEYAPQLSPRREDKWRTENKIVLDIGAGDTQYYCPDGDPIRIDIDPLTKPDIVADARYLHMISDCFADVVFSSHTLEHISFREVLSTIREWIRVLKIGGELRLVVPNLKWASNKILNEEYIQPEHYERALFMFHSAQKGSMREAYLDVHKSGYTPKQLTGLLERAGTLKDIEVYTSENNYKTNDDLRRNDDLGYNIIARATKVKHEIPIAIQDTFENQKI